MTMWVESSSEMSINQDEQRNEEKNQQMKRLKSKKELWKETERNNESQTHLSEN